MRKILLSACACIAMLNTVSAQQKAGGLLQPQKLDNTVIDGSLNKARFHSPAKKTRLGGSIFISYMDFVAAQEGISATDLDARRGLSYMFPDSVVRYGAPSTAYGIQWKSAGQILEPWADVIANNTPADNIVIGKTNAYTIDSVFIGGSYIRKTAAVDTLIVSLVHSGGANMPEFYFTGQVADFGVDTTKFLAQLYNPINFTTGAFQTNATGAPAATVIKYPLTNADSSTFTAPNSYGVKYLGIATNFAVPAGERASVSYTFKPGYAYNAGDTVANNNHYLFLSYEPNGDNTFMTFYPTDRNMSSVISKDSSGWGGLYIPTLAWTVGYGTEIHDIVWKASCPTCGNVGIDGVDNNGITINVTPNPASESTKFAINLIESAKNVNITFTNAVGQVSKSINIGSVNANSNQKINVNVSDLSKGMYIYTLTADGKKSTGKLMVN